MYVINNCYMNAVVEYTNKPTYNVLQCLIFNNSVNLKVISNDLLFKSRERASMNRITTNLT